MGNGYVIELMKIKNLSIISLLFLLFFPFSYGIPSKFLLLKCDFHVHTYLSDGTYSLFQVMALYKDYGYDVVAITDHNKMLNPDEIRGISKQFGIIGIAGEELGSTWKDGKVKHILGLFLQTPINQSHICFVKCNKTNEVKPFFDEIHKQAGIAIVAHPDYNSEWLNLLNNKTDFIDGWEVSDALVKNDSYVGNVYLLNHDFHSLDKLKFSLTNSYTLCYSYNRTEEGIKEALLSNRIVLKGLKPLTQDLTFYNALTFGVIVVVFLLFYLIRKKWNKEKNVNN